MPDIELPDILKIMCEVVGELQEDRKFYSQSIQPSSGSSHNTNLDQKIKTDNTDEANANSNMSDYFRSSINRVAHKRTSQVLMQKCTMNSVMFPCRNWVF